VSPERQAGLLDCFAILDDRRLWHPITDNADHGNRHRPHQGLGNRPPAGGPDPGPAAGRVVCEERLGGLLRHYRRAA
jgi:hypothetical protein